jgi:hypothetical protein
MVDLGVDRKDIEMWCSEVVMICVPLWGSSMSVIDFRISSEQGIPVYEYPSPL